MGERSGQNLESVLKYMLIYIIYTKKLVKINYFKNFNTSHNFPHFSYFLPGDFFLGDLEANPINSLAFLSNLRMT